MLLATEGVDLQFTDAAVRAVAQVAEEANKLLDNIGARRLHTVLERILSEARRWTMLLRLQLLLRWTPVIGCVDFKVDPSCDGSCNCSCCPGCMLRDRCMVPRAASAWRPKLHAQPHALVNPSSLWITVAK